MASFYFPFTIKISNIPVIVYPCVGIEKIFDRKEKGSIEKHLIELYDANAPLIKDKDNYHIVILWDNEGDRMTDVWLFGKPENWHSGPLVDVKIFRNLELETNIGVSAGDGLIMLGHEEIHRRSKSTFEEYINGERPKLPEGIAADEEFYQQS